MINSPGYTQAIENLVYAIRVLEAETIEPIFHQHPWLREIPIEEAEQFCDEQLSQEDVDKWIQLEVITRIISETYLVSEEQINADVELLICKNQLNDSFNA